MIFILMAFVVVNTQLISINQNSLCKCQQITDQDSCQQMGQICTWSNQQCISSPCSAIDMQNCAQTQNCSWSYAACLDFTDCQQLSGSSVSSCFSQNIRCSWISGTNCIPMSEVSCSQIYSQTSCTYSGNSLCYWNNGLCMDMSSCEQQTEASYCINESLGACYWEIDTCMPNPCAEQVLCQTTLSSPSNLNLFQVCVPGEYGFCLDGVPSDLDQADCLSKTKYTYYWSNKSGKEGGCQPCNYSALIIAMIFIQVIIL